MKKILMAAAAVTALTAGSAGAATITKALVSNVTVYDSAASTTSTPYKIASETKIGTSGTNTTNTTAENKVTLKVDQGKLAGGGSTSKDYTVTFTFAGPAQLQRDLVPGTDFTTDAQSGCVPSATIQSGGLAKGKTVDILMSLPSGCTTGASGIGPQNLSLDAPLTVTGIGDVTVTAKVSTGGTSIDNGEATARTLITNTSGISFTTDTDTKTTFWALAGTTPYTSLGGADATIGTYTLKYASTGSDGAYVAASRGTGTSTSGVTTWSNQFDQQDLKADVSISGDVTATTLKLGASGSTTNMTKNSAKDTSSRTGVGNSNTANIVEIVAVSDLTKSQSSLSYTMTVTPTTTASTFTIPAAKTQTLQTVGLEGTNFNVPWVAGSQSPSSTVIRIANNGTTDSGVVTVMIKSPIRNEGTTAGATTCTSSTLSSLGKIAAGGELLLGATELKSCFGDFKRGDLIVTIQEAKTNLTAKARLTTASGQISETSIGGLNEFGAY